MKTRVLIVDDSRTARQALRMALEAEGEIAVVGEAFDHESAVRLVAEHKPDLVTMDVYLGNDDGLAVTEELMSTHAVPILIVTSAFPKDPTLALRAIQLGALDVCAKLPSPRDPRYGQLRRRLARMVVALAGVPVVTRRRKTPSGVRCRPVRFSPEEVGADLQAQRYDLIAVGASAGGPAVLAQVLAKIAPPLCIPLVIVQHISEGFSEGLGTWLTQSTGHRVVLCHEPMQLDGGTVFLAPDGRHIECISRTKIRPFDGPARCYMKPSIDVLFESVARIYGRFAMGVVLTGMGQDGAEGLLHMRTAGAVTIAQDPRTCVVDGIVSHAIGKGAVQHILEPEQIAHRLNEARGAAGNNRIRYHASTG